MIVVHWRLKVVMKLFDWLVLGSAGVVSFTTYFWLDVPASLAETQPQDMPAVEDMPVGEMPENAPPADQARLSPEQVTMLMAFGYPVAVPAFVPAGFEVAEVEVLPPEPAALDPFNAGYRIAYRQTVATDTASPTCFEIEGALGGFGGPLPEQRMDASLPDFVPALDDYTYQLFWSDGSREAGPFTIPLLFSDWLEAERTFYRISSWATETKGCDRLSPELANQILASLQYLPETVE